MWHSDYKTACLVIALSLIIFPAMFAAETQWFTYYVIAVAILYIIARIAGFWATKHHLLIKDNWYEEGK